MSLRNKAYELILIFILLIISFLIALKITNKKHFFKARKTVLISYASIFGLIILFFIAIYFPRRVSRAFPKDDIKAVYYVEYENFNSTVKKKLDDDKIEDFVKTIKKATYIPTYHIMPAKGEKTSKKFFCIEYENRYVLLAEEMYWVREGTYNYDTIIYERIHYLFKSDNDNFLKTFNYDYASLVAMFD